MISRSCQNGIQAALYLAAVEAKGYVPVRRISDGLGISAYFLAKILQTLTRAGILQSYRGPNGGVALVEPPDRVTLKDLVVALDGPELFQECVLGLPGCGQEKPCPLHDQWSVVRACLTGTFEELTLAELARGIKAGTFDLEALLGGSAGGFFRTPKEDKR